MEYSVPFTCQLGVYPKSALPHSRCIKIAEPPVTATSFSVDTDSHTSVASHARFARSGGQEPRIRHHRECGSAPLLWRVCHRVGSWVLATPHWDIRRGRDDGLRDGDHEPASDVPGRAYRVRIRRLREVPAAFMAVPDTGAPCSDALKSAIDSTLDGSPVIAMVFAATLIAVLPFRMLRPPGRLTVR